MRPVAGLFLGYTIKGPPPGNVRAYVRHASVFALAALATHPSTPARRRRGAAR